MSDGASPAAYPSTYRTTYEASLGDPDAFWAEAAGLIDWVTPPTRILDADNPPFYRWYPDGELNVCHNAVDRHVAAGRGDQPAIRYDSPVTGTKETITYAALLARVRAVAGGLRGLGVEKGDRVVIYMPMVPEAVIAMLACARIGAVHSVVFGGFAPQELAARIDDAAPKVVLSASCGIEPSRVVKYKPFLDEAIHRSEHKPEACVILQRPQERAELGERDIDWERVRVRRGGPSGGGSGHGRRHRPALHPLHVGHDREAQGHLPRQRRQRRRAALVDGQPLRRRSPARRCSPRATSAGSSATRTSSTRRC